ncbi:hypothetical protein SAMN05892877_12190 [Rhizobium subbaraonis]|uniref:Uncharacterized protein n=1 Tax=Rhizobium subbaraonis TaxID=908946 RepID=A0A285UWL5_9HYPH|nr:hypothetical protein [Rhizobium subbaraonis]SOC46284.1 hypothetical protein SAMN05892877_12190 [Rhizobium subbaraonis]
MLAASTSSVILQPISARARAIVRRAGASADKTFFNVSVDDEAAIAEAVEAGYLVLLRGHDTIWRITARGEAYLTQLRGAH